jgi:COP9 signalosome complex subunit 5
MDQLYAHPDEKVEAVRAQKAWMADPKHFTTVKLSPSATIKMLMHGQQGVNKGSSLSGKPLEVMGLLLGRPDHENPHVMIVSDALPLPVEGFETRVVAEDADVANYMIELSDSLEMTRKERFCGWYHTHPFDLDGTSHCYLSATDISTQLLWQLSEDPHGNPWVAIVIDPLLSLDQRVPEMMAFRVYPPAYTAPPNETPDGSIVKNDAERVGKWGSCWNSYYRMTLEHYMSGLASNTLSILHNQLLWHEPLSAAVSSGIVSCFD